MAALEPKVREYCARSLDPLVGTSGFDFVADLGAMVPMRTIGMLLGIPEEHQEAIRDKINDGLRLKEGAPPPRDMYERLAKNQKGVFAEYIAWRAKKPSDDVISKLLTAEFEDTNGERRRLTNDEVLGYVNLLAAAGNETTTRLIGWAGKVLAEHPDQRRDLVNNLGLVPNAIEELCGTSRRRRSRRGTSPRTSSTMARRFAAGSVMLLLTGSANRDERRYENADKFDIDRKRWGTSPSGTASTSVSAPPWPASRAASLSRKCSNASRVGGRLGEHGASPYLDRARLGATSG